MRASVSVVTLLLMSHQILIPYFADASLEEPNVQSDSQLCATKSTQAG